MPIADRQRGVAAALVEACGYTLLGDGPELAPGRPSVRYGKVLAGD